MVLAAGAALGVAAVAQDGAVTRTVAAEPMPGSAAELMAKAAKVNGLLHANVRPWRVKASYKVFNDDGSLRSEGTFDEIWASPTKYRITWASGDAIHSEYMTDKGMYNGGGTMPDIVQGFRVQREMLDPLEPAQGSPANTYAVVEREAGGIAAVCVQRQEVDGRTFGPAWCLDHDTANLLITVNGSSEDALHSNPVSFEGQTIAGDLKFSAGELKNIESDQPAFSAHLEVIEPLANVDDPAFSPPADAHPEFIGGIVGVANVGAPGAAPMMQIPKKVNISGGVAQGLLVEKVPPVYPMDAKAAGVSGTVVLQATIGKDGHIEDLRVVSGPEMLQQAALDSVRQWVYRPYLLNGESVEVNTTVNIVFSLGR